MLKVHYYLLLFFHGSIIVKIISKKKGTEMNKYVLFVCHVIVPTDKREGFYFLLFQSIPSRFNRECFTI